MRQAESEKLRVHQAQSKRKTRETDILTYNKQAEIMKQRMKEVELHREKEFLKMYND